MAHSLSAKKRVRQGEKKRMKNRARKSVLKGALKTTNERLLHGSASDAQKAIYDATRLLDREANRGTLHPNAAARRKSRLMKRLHAAQKKPAGAVK